MAFGNRKTSLVVDYDKLARVGEILHVRTRAGVVSPTAVIDAALETVITQAARGRALEIMADPELVDLELGRSGWR